MQMLALLSFSHDKSPYATSLVLVLSYLYLITSLLKSPFDAVVSN